MLKRIKLGFCDNKCIDGCIAEEIEIQKEIIDFFITSGAAYSCTRTREGITVVTGVKSSVENFFILYTKNQIRVEHVTCNNLGYIDRHAVVVFRNVPEMIQFIARNMPLDDCQPRQTKDIIVL